MQKLHKGAIFIIAGYRGSIFITMGYNDVKANREICLKRLQHSLPNGLIYVNFAEIHLRLPLRELERLPLKFPKAPIG